MWTPHSSVGLAQSIFYFPIIISAALLLFRRHTRPRMPWIALYMFSIGKYKSPFLPTKYSILNMNQKLVRFVGGIMFIIYTNNANQVGWIIVAIILEGAGVIPLLLVLVGFVRLMSVILHFTIYLRPKHLFLSKLTCLPRSLVTPWISQATIFSANPSLPFVSSFSSVLAS